MVTQQEITWAELRGRIAAWIGHAAHASRKPLWIKLCIEAGFPKWIID